jgi:hypothetical protein
MIPNTIKCVTHFAELFFLFSVYVNKLFLKFDMETNMFTNFFSHVLSVE